MMLNLVFIVLEVVFIGLMILSFIHQSVMGVVFYGILSMMLLKVLLEG